MTRDSVVLLEQIRTLDKHRLRACAGCIDPEDQRGVDDTIGVSFLERLLSIYGQAGKKTCQHK